MSDKKEKKEKKDKKEKKEKRKSRDDASERAAKEDAKRTKGDERETDGGLKVHGKTKDADAGKASSGAPAPGTFPTSNTHVYMGNLAWTIDEKALKEAFKDCGEVASVNWFEEKATGKFLGAGVVEFTTPEGAAAAVKATGRVIHSRETPIRFWEKRGNTAEERAEQRKAQGKVEAKPMGEKPAGCYTLFMGNLNFQIDDDAIWKFFKDNAGVEPTTVRWLTNKDTGEFRGVGFADFADDESLEAAAKCNGLPCMGRPIRMDYQAPSNRG